MAYTLPDLTYAKNALEPHIDAQTMEIHHDKHHAAYVANLNKALEGQDALSSKSIEDLIGDLAAVPDAIRGAVRNNGGGHANHSLFWKILTPGGAKEPSGKLAEAITAKFGGRQVWVSRIRLDAGQAIGINEACRPPSIWPVMLVGECCEIDTCGPRGDQGRG